MTNEEKSDHRMIPIQSIQQRHLFNYNREKMRQLLVEKALVINPEYAMSQEIIYNYDEIEWTLRNEVSGLPRIDVQNIRYFNYQFELYDESVSVISNIRERFKQKLINDEQRSKVHKFLDKFDEASILELSNSLEYIFAYLGTVTNESILNKNADHVGEVLTIAAFSDQYKLRIIKRFQDQPLVSVQLNNIVDLYLVVEEMIFDKILFEKIKDEFQKKFFQGSEFRLLVSEFIGMITESNQIADCLRDLECWISMFKCLLTRLHPLTANIDFDLPLADYVKRTDMWKENISKENLQTIPIKDEICLKHAFGILEGLKQKKDSNKSSRKFQDPFHNENEQRTPGNTGDRVNPLTRPKDPPKRKTPKKNNDFY